MTLIFLNSAGKKNYRKLTFSGSIIASHIMMDIPSLPYHITEMAKQHQATSLLNVLSSKMFVHKAIMSFNRHLDYYLLK